MKRTISVLFVVTITMLIILTGCSSYAPQPNLPPNIESVAVPVFSNKTDRPNIEQYITQKTIDEFISDGKVTIKDVYKCDAVVKCDITKYVLTPILFDTAQVPQQYRMRVYVTISFFDNRQQRELWKTQDIWEETTYYVVNNLGMPAEDEEAAKIRVLDQLSSKIVRRVIYGSTN